MLLDETRNFDLVLMEAHLPDFDQSVLLRVSVGQKISTILTTAVSGLEAVLMLSDETRNFELVIMEAHLPDFDQSMLLQESVAQKIPTILMSCDKGNAMVAEMALQKGVFYVEKPVSMTILQNLWQHVMKYKTTEDNSEDSEGGIAKKRRSVYEEMSGNYESGKERTPYIEWTEELHAKFMDAANQLGDDKCFPKDILELMNEPGLTCIQVASHLQQCRQGNWHGPEDSTLGTIRYGATPCIERASNISDLLPQENEAAPVLYDDLDAVFDNLSPIIPDWDALHAAFTAEFDKITPDKTPNPDVLHCELEEALGCSQHLGDLSFVNCGSDQEDAKPETSSGVTEANAPEDKTN